LRKAVQKMDSFFIYILKIIIYYIGFQLIRSIKRIKDLIEFGLIKKIVG